MFCVDYSHWLVAMNTYNEGVINKLALGQIQVMNEKDTSK
jgi:hypothetical protein